MIITFSLKRSNQNAMLQQYEAKYFLATTILSLVFLCLSVNLAKSETTRSSEKLDEQFMQFVGKIDECLLKREYSKAEELSLQLQQFVENQMKGDSEALVYAIYYQGKVFQEQEFLPKAIAHYNKAIGIQKAQFPENQEMVFVLSLGLGEVAVLKKDYTQAVSHYKKVITATTKLFGKESAPTSRQYNALGLILVELNQLDEAIAAFKQSLTGVLEHEKGIVYRNLARAYLHKEKFNEADQAYAKAVPIFQAIVDKKKSRFTYIDYSYLDDDVKTLKDTLLEWSTVCEKLGYTKKAKTTRRKALKLQESGLEGILAIAGKLFEGNYGKQIKNQQHNANAHETEEKPAQSFEDLAKLIKEGRTEELEKGSEARGRALRASIGTMYYDLIRIREELYGKEDPKVAEALMRAALRFRRQGRYLDALPMLERALKIQKSFFGEDDPETAKACLELAYIQCNVGKFIEAEPLFKNALRIQYQFNGAKDPCIADIYLDLATIYINQVRLEEAMNCLQVARHIYEAIGRETEKYGYVYYRLAQLSNISHNAEYYEDLLRKALSIFERSTGNASRISCQARRELAQYFIETKQWDQASDFIKIHTAVAEKSVYGKDSEEYAHALWLKGILLVGQEKKHDAEASINKAIAALEGHLGPAHPEMVTLLMELGEMYNNQHLPQKVNDILTRAISTCDISEVSYGTLCDLFCMRGQARWNMSKRDLAIMDIKAAMDNAELQRASFSGDAHTRARSFRYYIYAFEQMVAWQTTLNNPGEAFNAIERCRARSLLDQMEINGNELLVDVPEEEAIWLRKQMQKSQTQLIELKKQLDLISQQTNLPKKEKIAKINELLKQKRETRKNFAAAYADIRNASPAYRLAVGKDRKPVSLAKLSEFIKLKEGMLFEYLIGKNDGFLLIINPAGESRMQKLSLTEGQATSLGVEPGALNASKLQTSLRNENETGVLQLLAEANNAETTQKVTPGLATLWEVLVPEPERKAITDGACEQIFVLPDANLAQLPFETLVVEQGEDPKYLLDVGPAVIYAPSATILMNLVEREVKQSGPDAEVVTIGNPTYPGNPVQPPENMLAMRSTRSRFGAAGGHLSALPHTKTETRWVKEVYAEKNASVLRLNADDATEANVRSKIPGRRVVHLACHGLVDQKYGNLFGALALTPGKDSENMEDDGFLTLSEVYGLDLKSCELAILSACNTNFGPQQRGEGTWAISRGFLVAGAKRVVASNWLVDDEAAASLVSYFCGGVAEGGDVDHAKSLQAAKRWIKDNPDHPNWKHPYYWAPFILVGPQ